MTEPDEALLYVREHWATICDEDGFPDEAECYRRGDNDQALVNDAHFYRAGQAASAERIKALENMIKLIQSFYYIPHLDTKINALLKEADQ